MPPGSNPVRAGRRTVLPMISIAAAPSVERVRVARSAPARAHRTSSRIRRAGAHRARWGRRGRSVSRQAATARSTSSRVSGETTTGAPACRVSALTSLRLSNRLQRRSRSAMPCSASSASDAGPPTVITWASLPMARNLRSTGMGRGVLLGRGRCRPRRGPVVDRLELASSSDVYANSPSSRWLSESPSGRSGPVAVFAVAAMQPVSANRLVMLSDRPRSCGASGPGAVDACGIRSCPS